LLILSQYLFDFLEKNITIVSLVILVSSYMITNVYILAQLELMEIPITILVKLVWQLVLNVLITHHVLLVQMVLI
jgi:hypothetical protein